jgi:type VI secretion system protein ImpE
MQQETSPHDRNSPVAQALAEGRLREALVAAQQLVTQSPTNPVLRLQLAELLAVAGRWRSAHEELLRIESSSSEWPQAREGFTHALRALTQRHRGRRGWLAPPNPHARRRANAWRTWFSNAREESQVWMDRAERVAPTVTGFIDGRPFDNFRDADDRFGCVFELLVEGRYGWLPVEHLRTLTLLPASGWLDSICRPAQVRLRDGTEFPAMLPLVYPGSHRAEGAFALGQETDWLDCGGPACGIGARILLLGEEELALADCTQIEIRTAWVPAVVTR